MGSNVDLSTDGDEFWLFGYGSLIWKPPPHFDRRIPGWVTGYVRRFWQTKQEALPASRPSSQDHRGTPTAPGRVVTLIERAYWASLADAHDSAPDRVWGVAYRIRKDKVAEVRDYLDIREINGYTIHHAPFYPAPPNPEFTEAGAETAGSGAGGVKTTDGGGAGGQDGNDDEETSSATHPFRDGRTIRTLVYIGTPTNDQFVGPQDPDELAAHIRGSVGPSGLNTEYLLNLDEALQSLSLESGDDHIRDLSRRVRAIMAADGGRNPRPPQDLESAVPLARTTSADEEQEETEKPHAPATTG